MRWQAALNLLKSTVTDILPLVPSSELAAQVFSLLDAHMLYGVWHVTSDSPIHTDQSPLPRTNPEMAQVALDCVSELAAGRLPDKKEAEKSEVTDKKEGGKSDTSEKKEGGKSEASEKKEGGKSEGSNGKIVLVDDERRMPALAAELLVRRAEFVLVEWVRGEGQLSYDTPVGKARHAQVRMYVCMYVC